MLSKSFSHSFGVPYQPIAGPLTGWTGEQQQLRGCSTLFKISRSEALLMDEVYSRPQDATSKVKQNVEEDTLRDGSHWLFDANKDVCRHIEHSHQIKQDNQGILIGRKGNKCFEDVIRENRVFFGILQRPILGKRRKRRVRWTGRSE